LPRFFRVENVRPCRVMNRKFAPIGTALTQPSRSVGIGTASVSRSSSHQGPIGFTGTRVASVSLPVSVDPLRLATVYTVSLAPSRAWHFFSAGLPGSSGFICLRHGAASNSRDYPHHILAKYAVSWFISMIMGCTADQSAVMSTAGPAQWRKSTAMRRTDNRKLPSLPDNNARPL
jgi:hypothetical protein